MIWYLRAEQSTPAKASLPESAFDGLYGVDTENILAISSIDFGSSPPLHRDPVHYRHSQKPTLAGPNTAFPQDEQLLTTEYIWMAVNRLKWVAVHSNTATIFHVL